MADVLANPIVIGVLIGLPSFALGYLGLRRSQQTDKATAATDAVGQIISGLNLLIDNLSDDNVDQRGQIISLREQVTACGKRLESMVEQRDELKQTIAKMVGGIGIVFLLALLLGSQASEHRRADRAVQVERSAARADVKEQVETEVQEEVKSEVTDQLDERLLTPSTLRPVPSDVPDELLPVEPATTTTLEGPFNLTTTTTESPPTTTTTIIEVPTTVTLPPLPLP